MLFLKHARASGHAFLGTKFLVSRDYGYLRKKRDSLESKASWMLLLCVMRIFGSVVGARVEDVLREICSKWTLYLSTTEFVL
jgi:hypothetical protein